MTQAISPISLFLRALRALGTAAVWGLCVSVGLAFAGPDRDHGDAASAAGSTASPRIAAHSDLFELVGIVGNGQMTVYLDRYVTNEPIANAKIEFESGAHQGLAQPQADGTYLIKFDALAKPGQLSFSFTIAAGTETDLLAGDLEIVDHHEDDHAETGRPWWRWLGYAFAVVIALGIAVLYTRRVKSTRSAGLPA